MNALEREIYGQLFGESDEGDFNPNDFNVPEMDEGADESDVDTMLNAIQNGDDGQDDPGSIDSELDELEKEFNIAAAASSGAMVNMTDNIDPTGDELGDVEPLSPEDDALGDKMLAATVTPDFIGSTLTEEEYDDFVESGDMYTAADEGYITDSFIMEAMAADNGVGDLFMEDSKFAPAGKKMKMTKAARFKQLYEVSLQIEARLHNDPLYPKMMKVYEIRRRIKSEWRKKYHQPARKRALTYLKNIIASKSNGIKKMAARLMGKKAA